MSDQCYCVADRNVTYCRQYLKVDLIMFIRVFANITLSKIT